MDIKAELKKRADFFDKELEKFLKGGEPETLYDAVRHLPLAGGKRLRPVIAMISCEAVKGDVINVLPLAIGLELIHNFTLVHDDIIAGDLLFAKSFEAMHKITGDLSIFKNVEYGLIDCVRLISEGQQLDIGFENCKIVSENDYLEMILKKTAVLFMYASEAGGILGGGSSEQNRALNEYGKSLGLAFQIHDDYLDMSSDEKTLGKDIGNDIRNGKKTLIAVHSLNNAKGEDKKALEKIFGNRNATDEEVKEVYRLFNKTKSVEYAKITAVDYCKKAKKVLDVLPDTEAKKILLGLADYSIQRKK